MKWPQTTIDHGNLENTLTNRRWLQKKNKSLNGRYNKHTFMPGQTPLKTQQLGKAHPQYYVCSTIICQYYFKRASMRLKNTRAVECPWLCRHVYTTCHWHFLIRGASIRYVSLYSSVSSTVCTYVVYSWVKTVPTK